MLQGWLNLHYRPLQKQTAFIKRCCDVTKNGIVKVESHHIALHCIASHCIASHHPIGKYIISKILGVLGRHSVEMGGRCGAQRRRCGKRKTGRKRASLTTPCRRVTNRLPSTQFAESTVAPVDHPQGGQAKRSGFAILAFSPLGQNPICDNCAYTINATATSTTYPLISKAEYGNFRTWRFCKYLKPLRETIKMKVNSLKSAHQMLSFGGKQVDESHASLVLPKPGILSQKMHHKVVPPVIC